MRVFLRLLAGLAAAAFGSAALGRYRGEITEIRRRAKTGGRMALTAAGLVEYAEAASGPPAFVVHGAGGGYDQGLLLGRSFAGFRIIAPSRFGYLGTPAPQDISPAAQADAHAALLDTLGVERTVVAGVSAGAPSAVELALRHPERVRALVLIVPRGYWPEQPAQPRPANAQVMRLVMTGADVAWWLAMRLARRKVVQFLGVPPEIEARASPAERARVDEIMRSVLPLSMRIVGIGADSAVTLNPLPLKRIAAPTLVISARDDLFNTLAAAEHLAKHIPHAKFVVLDSGGHLMVGRDREVDGAIADFLESTASGKPQIGALGQPV